ncbi:MAG: xanthine dehydrogenase family protein subunit M [Rhodospirillales bacterium]|nr:xanthine dehydrogenase family protein subunit M [Rhodospirillales bacterium]
MSSLRFEAPETVEDAVRLLADADGEAMPLAGGTDLLVQLRTDFVRPGLIVDLKRIPALMDVSVNGDDIRVGAAVSGATLGKNEAVKAAWPGVVEALELIGSTQIQGRASLGGNLCNGSPAADSVPALIAAGAVAEIAGPNGGRSVPVENVITGPGQLSLGPGEIVVSLVMPKPPPRSGDAYLRFIPRTEMDIAVVGAGVALTIDGAGVCTHARLGLGAVAPTPLLVEDGANALIGTKVDDDALANLAAAASAACNPIDDKRGTIEYRVKVAGVLARRAALIALERARSNG